MVAWAERVLAITLIDVTFNNLKNFFTHFANTAMSTITPFATQVFAVKPTKFRSNAEALFDNKFMNTDLDTDNAEFDARIQRQHEQFVRNIEDAGIAVDLFTQPCDDAPDAVFPDSTGSLATRARTFLKACSSFIR